MSQVATSPAEVREPAVRPDGLCARPGCSRQRKPELSQRYGGAAAELDPFCSADCCREFYGVRDRTELGRPAHSGERMAGPIIHGTEHAYGSRGCRCEACTEAARQARARRRSSQTPSTREEPLSA